MEVLAYASKLFKKIRPEMSKTVLENHRECNPESGNKVGVAYGSLSRCWMHKFFARMGERHGITFTFELLESNRAEVTMEAMADLVSSRSSLKMTDAELKLMNLPIEEVQLLAAAGQLLKATYENLPFVMNDDDDNYDINNNNNNPMDIDAVI